MIEVNMPQDIMKYKTKFVGNFSLRESICAFLGVSAGLFGWFTLFADFAENPRMICTAILVFPFLAAGFFKPLGMTAEKALTTVFVDNFLAPAKRKYEVHHPEYEKFVRYEGNDYLATENEETNSKKKKKQKQGEQKLLKEVKVKSCKEYKAIK